MSLPCFVLSCRKAGDVLAKQMLLASAAGEPTWLNEAQPAQQATPQCSWFFTLASSRGCLYLVSMFLEEDYDVDAARCAVNEATSQSKSRQLVAQWRNFIGSEKV